MFIVREYAACVLVALFAAMLFLAGCGIFLALKAGCRIAATTLRSFRGAQIREAHVARIASLITVLFLIILLRVARAHEPPASQSRAHKLTAATLERPRAELPVRGAAPATPLPGGMQ
jgi:hypothetical protein